MSKKRALDSCIRTSQTFAALSYRQRDLWQGLIAIADDQGRLPGLTAYVRSQVWPFDDIPLAEVEVDLQQLIDVDMILKYEVDGKLFIQLINWWKYQSPQWAGPSDFPAPPGWMDRKRYHGKEHVIITENWDLPGGFISADVPIDKPPDLSGDKSPEEQPDIRVSREEEEVKEDKEELKRLAGARAPAEKPLKYPERDAVIKHFLIKTRLPAPKTDNAHIKETQKLWWTPAVDLLELVDNDIGAAIGLIDSTLKSMDGLTVSSFKSILSNARDEYAKNHRESVEVEPPGGWLQ